MRTVRGSRLPAAPARTADVVVTGELDLATGPALCARLETALALRPSCLQVDLSGCTFLDCSTVGLLESVRDGARVDGTVLVLVRPSRPVRRLLALLGLQEAFALG